MAPHQVTPKTVPEVWDRLYGQRLEQKTPPPRCRVGDRVRLNKKHRPFKKGYLPFYLQTRCAKSASVGGLVISGRKSLETQRTQRVGTVETVASQVR